MIWFDVTKAGKQRHSSGLRRVSACLARELGAAARPFSWGETAGGGLPSGVEAGDWLVTTELFDAMENAPACWRAALAGTSRTVRLGAVFHDAIPLRHPEITWPHSVARHPAYMKALARFDRVWAVSEASRAELLGFWRWQRVESVPPVDLLTLGADADGAARVTERRAPAGKPLLLCVGILEPRKNQLLVLEAAEALWARGLDFSLHLVGRVNPHFGAPIVARVAGLRRAGRPVWHHSSADDSAVAALHARARVTLFPTLAEGCGLPLLESLWRGVPCVCSDLPVLMENAAAGGCLAVRANDAEAWRVALAQVLTDDALVARLGDEARSRPLPTWSGAARLLREGCA